MTRPSSNALLAAAGVLWLISVVAGFRVLWVYSSTPAPTQLAAPATWPAGTPITRDVTHDGRYTLVMAVHPQCPCTRASMGELAELITRLRDRVSCHLLFLRPAGMAEGWERADLWNRAGELGATRHVDAGGAEARRFGASASGHVVLYDPAGRLVFSGGITGARGHLGDNAGRQAVVTGVANGAPVCARTPTYGCPLEEPRVADVR